MNEYEQLRLKNLEDNRKILAEIGLINPYKSLPKVSFKKGVRGNKRKAEESNVSRPRKIVTELDPETTGSLRGSRRRSARIQEKDVPTDSELKDEVDQWNDENEAPTPKVPPNRPNFYGAVPGVEVGTLWVTRLECCRDGVHRPTVAGIHAGAEGAYSIALSGGYEDNIDLGDCFTYTGEGGRDLKGTASNPKNLRTAPQSKDQQLTRGNLALSRNVETGNVVRVIRGYKLKEFSPFAPDDGYRYDGLYTVEKFWSTYGASGFLVWKFALRRCSDQPPPPWTFDESSSILDGKSDSGFDSDETGSQISSSQSSAGSQDTAIKTESQSTCSKGATSQMDDVTMDDTKVSDKEEPSSDQPVITDDVKEENTNVLDKEPCSDQPIITDDVKEEDTKVLDKEKSSHDQPIITDDVKEEGTKVSDKTNLNNTDNKKSVTPDQDKKDHEAH